MVYNNFFDTKGCENDYKYSSHQRWWENQH